MKFYHFTFPIVSAFAEATRRGTWYLPPGVRGICPECGRPNERRVPPLIIEWEVGSDKVGAFTWPGFDEEIVVTQDVRDLIERRFGHVTFNTIEMYQQPKLKRPERITRRTKPRVWLPYEGPPIWDMTPTKTCNLDLVKSRFHLEYVCATCQRPKYTTPRFEDRDLAIDPTTWEESDIFYIAECVGLTFCTERVVDAINGAGFTNVDFLLDGRIPE
jgi:hypothetical protein